MPRIALFCATVLALASFGQAATWTVNNPTGQTYVDEAIRLHLPVPAEPFTVKQDGAPVPYQVETVDGKPFIWALVSMAKGESRTFATEPGARATGPQVVKLTRDGASWVLDNGKVAAKVPAEAAALVPPVQAVRLPDGRWIGRGSWITGLKLTRFSSTVIGDGQVFAKVRLRYDFDALVGVDGKTPAFAEIDVALYPGQRHLVIEDRHEMGRDDAWEFDLCAGWNARTPMLEVFGGGAGRAKNPAALPKDLTPLGWDRAALQKRYDTGDPRLGDTLMWLIPRANQHYEDGWMFAVTDGALAVGAIPARAGRWFWPNDNKLDVRLKATADYAGLRGPTRHGARYWYLVVGTRNDFSTFAAGSHALRYGFQGLDKLLVDYITDWPGKAAGDFYAGYNPLFLSRGFMRDMGQAGPPNTPMGHLTAFQVALDPDMYGEYWQFMSPENPNFFTGFYNGSGIAHLAALETHPRYGDLKRLAAMKAAEDIYHSFTLPGGAGQECPGYMSVGSLSKLSERCAGYPMDAEIKERIAAALRFKKRSSYPDGAVRRNSPMGDSHPGKGDAGMTILPVTEGGEDGWMTTTQAAVRAWRTEELPGYGVAFINNPGTPRESNLCFKSGPNRGHYHGDQLAFHYCADARPVAVDHHCSYAPRAGQEAMHNRLSFGTPEMPWANMDGYERLIAYRPSDAVDIAIGQVESNRLRWVQPFPPEDWDRDFPQVALDPSLRYRRTVVFMKGAPHDYVVLRDQYVAPLPLEVAWNLHVNDDPLVFRTEPGKGGASDGTVTLRDEARDFVALGARPGWRVYTVEPMRSHVSGTYVGPNAEYTVTAVGQHTLTLDRAPAASNDLQYALLRGISATPGVPFRVGSLALLATASEGFRTVARPWWHGNGGYEITQGVRLETQGREGEFVTVLYPVAPDAPLPPMSAVAGGVRVGGDVITFGGGVDQVRDTVYVRVKRAGKEAVELAGGDINMERFQGNIGLFVPNTGYPFGDIPDWLIRQRQAPPAWYKPVMPLGYRQE